MSKTDINKIYVSTVETEVGSLCCLNKFPGLTHTQIFPSPFATSKEWAATGFKCRVKMYLPLRRVSHDKGRDHDTGNYMETNGKARPSHTEVSDWWKTIQCDGGPRTKGVYCLVVYFFLKLLIKGKEGTLGKPQ